MFVQRNVAWRDRRPLARRLGATYAIDYLAPPAPPPFFFIPMKSTDGNLQNLRAGTVVQITYGGFTGIEGKVVRNRSVNDSAALVLTPDARREDAILVRTVIDGEPVILGVSREYLVLP